MTMGAHACGGHRLTLGVFSAHLHSPVLELQMSSKLEIPAQVLTEQSTLPT